MKTKSRSLIRRGLAWLAGIFIIISVLFPVITVPIYSSQGAKDFKIAFDSKQKGVVVMSLDEWADTFAGSFGLKDLDLLSHDPDLMPSGRRIAVEIHDRILSGRHQPHLVSMLRQGWYMWPISCAIAYVYVVDGLRTGHWINAPLGPEWPY